MPVLEALLSRKESARSEERVERFRAYVLAAMAMGSSYGLGGGSSRRSISRTSSSQRRMPPGRRLTPLTPSAPSGLGGIGLNGEGG